jgi:quercetin dioxygenase-like cupin family protein
MSARPDPLQRFIDALEATITARSDSLPSVRPVASKIFEALRVAEFSGGGAAPRRPVVCEQVSSALENAARGPEPVPGLARAFAAIEPQLAWAPRQGASEVPGGFADRHANAVIVGEGGLEWSDTVRIGTSLVAPGTDYPRHRHPPEELYVVLSPGAWMQNDHAPQFQRTGDLVHNVPNIWHAMSAGREPLLAIWCLWMADA